MTVNFSKYQGTGNDFILIDNRSKQYNKLSTDLIKRLCDRKFGIGADGLILLNEKISYDFEMLYYNSDGNESSMCGNGGRCLIKFAQELGLKNKEVDAWAQQVDVVLSHYNFWAIDGPHDGDVLANGLISLKMKDVDKIEEDSKGNYIIQTGSPHCVIFTPGVESIDIVKEGRDIRYSDRFKKEGINVNFVQQNSDSIFVRTYERGVEDETLSCGTGVVAAALASVYRQTRKTAVRVTTKGGQLEVHYEAYGKGFKNIHLIGPAEKVFAGSINTETP